MYTREMIPFVRHGQTLSGLEERFEGRSDSSLTDFGREQVEMVGTYLKTLDIDRLLVSPRGRAIETATILGTLLENSFIIEGRIAEVCYGDWEKKKRSELVDTVEWAERERNFFRFVHPGSYESIHGESYAQMYDRVVPLLQALAEERTNICVVSHSGILRCARKFFDMIGDEEFQRSKFENSVLYQVKKTRGFI
jgi:probable phosphoglycerate mutase